MTNTLLADISIFTALKQLLPLMIVGFFGAITPGPDIFLTLKTTLRFGGLQGLKVLCGIASGWVCYLGLIYAGAIHWLNTPIAQMLLSLIGGSYLLYLSYNILKTPSKHYHLHSQNIAKSGYLSGLIINISNPKAVLFFIFLITPFLNENLLSLSLISLFCSLFSAFLLIIILACFGRKFINQSFLNTLDKICGILFVGFSWLLYFEFGKLFFSVSLKHF